MGNYVTPAIHGDFLGIIQNSNPDTKQITVKLLPTKELVTFTVPENLWEKVHKTTNADWVYLHIDRGIILDINTLFTVRFIRYKTLHVIADFQFNTTLFTLKFSLYSWLTLTIFSPQTNDLFRITVSNDSITSIRKV